MKKLKRIAPIWVINPETNRKIDVSAFIQALNTFDRKPGSKTKKGGLTAVRRMLRHMNSTIHDRNLTSFDAVARLYHDLGILEDMFKQTREQAEFL